MNNNGLDTAIVASAVSAPLWMQELSILSTIIFTTVGTIVAIVRLYWMFKDRKSDAGRNSGG